MSQPSPCNPPGGDLPSSMCPATRGADVELGGGGLSAAARAKALRQGRVFKER